MFIKCINILVLRGLITSGMEREARDVIEKLFRTYYNGITTFYGYTSG